MTGVDSYTAGETIRLGDLVELHPEDNRVYRYNAYPSRWERLLRRWRIHPMPILIGGAGRDVKKGETLLIVRGASIVTTAVKINPVVGTVLPDGSIEIGRDE